MFECFFFYTYEDEMEPSLVKQDVNKLFTFLCVGQWTLIKCLISAAFQLGSTRNPSPTFGRVYFIEIWVKLDCAI